MDIMYKVPVLSEEDEDEIGEYDAHQDDAHQEPEADDEAQMDATFHHEENPADEVLPDLLDTYHETLKSIRCNVKFFRH